MLPLPEDWDYTFLCVSRQGYSDYLYFDNQIVRIKS